MTKTLITRDKFKISPWKNGAGLTAEIAIWPDGTDFRKGEFKWRLSSARVEDENDFSSFPGYSRILTILSGEGLLLNGQELMPFEIFEFEGEEKIQCTPINGPVEDLGVIFLRGQYRCSMRLLNVSEPQEQILEEGVHFFLPLAAEMDIAEIEFSAPDFLRIDCARTDPPRTSFRVNLSAPAYPAPVLQVSLREESVMQ